MSDATAHDRRPGVAVVVTVVAGAGVVSLAVGLPLISALATPTGAPAVHTVLAAALFVLAAAVAEIVRVPMMHGDAREDFTFFEIVTVSALLVLAPTWALLAPLVGLLLTQVALRKPLVKGAFNVGSYAVATTVAVVAYLLVAGGTDRFSARGIVALLVAMTLFAVINTELLARILHVSQGIDRGDVIKDLWAESVLMMVGGIGVGAVAVAVAPISPLLLPFTLLPALALWYAYNSAAQRLLERDRNRWLVELSGILAQERPVPVLLADAAEAIRKAFGAAVVRVDVDEDPRLVALLGDSPAELPAALRPADWTHAVATRLELGTGRRGLLLLGGVAGSQRPWTLSTQDQVMLTTVAASLSSAVRGVEHKDALVEESSKLKAVVEHASDGIAVIARDGGVSLWSPAMTRITGVDAETAMAGSGTHPAALEALVALAATAGEPGSRPAAPTTVSLTRADGDLRDVSVSVVRANPFGDGEQVAILTVHDVTAQARADRLKSDFVATISHELRTPITPIKGYAQLLLARGDAMAPDRRRAALELIADRADHLGRLVEDLLMASRASGTVGSALAVSVDALDLRDIVTAAVSSFPSLAGRLEVEQPDTAVPVHCDSVRTVQILSNLLSNADKYAPADTRITLRVLPTEFGDTHVHVQVVDHGCGLAEEDLDRIFERFYRVEDSMTMHTSGTGIGLYIARELATTMGGGLHVASAPGQGSTFTVSLPRTRAEAPEATRTTVSPPAPQQSPAPSEYARTA